MSVHAILLASIAVTLRVTACVGARLGPRYNALMTGPKSNETERLLRELFSGKPKLRERALLAVDAKDRNKVRHLAKVRQDAMLV